MQAWGGEQWVAMRGCRASGWRCGAAARGEAGCGAAVRGGARGGARRGVSYLEVRQVVCS